MNLPRQAHLTTLSLLAAAILALIAAAPLAAQAPAFLPGDEVVGPSAGNQQAPALARGGDTTLVVWADQRAHPTGRSYYEYETASDIYGLRLDAAGNPLETVPFVITQAPSSQVNPQVAWNGSHWLVVFETNDISGTGYYYQKALGAVRVAPDGQVADAAPIKIFNLSPTAGSWAVASDGAGWAITGQSSDGNSSLLAIRIAASGAVEQPPKRLVASTYYLRNNVRLAFAAGVYLFTWTDYTDTLALRLDPDLNLLDPEPLLLLSDLSLNDLATNGSQFYAIWSEQQPDFTVALKGSRISQAGALLDGAGVNISGSSQPQAYTISNVAWDETYWRPTWGFNNALRIGRVTVGGQALDPNGVAVAGPSTGLTAGRVDGGVNLVWSLFVANQYDVLTASVNPANVAGPNRTLSVGAHAQTRADVAIGASGSMFVFRSDDYSDFRVMAQPLDASGTPLRPEPIVLDSGDYLTGPGTPSVAWNGSHYLVSWANSDGIVAQRLSQAGTPVDPVPFLVMPGFGPTDVAALGSDFMIVGLKIGFNVHSVLPVAARVTGDGTVLDPGGITLGSIFVRSVAVTTLGNRWLAVWHRTYSHDDTLGETMAAFVDQDGASPGQFQVYGPYSMGGGNGIFEVTAASSGTTALVVQSAEISSGVETDLVGRLVNTDGSLQPALTLTPWAGNQYRPNAAWDGNQFVVVYNEQKNRFAPFTLDQLDARSDLFGMRLSESGAILDARGFAFSLSSTAEAFPTVAAANGVSLIAGSILRNEAPFAAYRIGFARFGVGGNQWPVAVAAASTGGGDMPLSLSFSAIGSQDPDGNIVSYMWSFGDGATSTLGDPDHTYTEPGNYVATLTVTDDGGAQTIDAVPVAVTAPNLPPVAVATADPSGGPAPLYVTFYAEGSYDPDGTIGNIQWEFSDGGTYWGSTAYHTFAQPGTHTATVTVFDNRGGTGSATVTIEVGGPNQPPVAVAAATPTGGQTPLTVDFTSAGSYDPDGNITGYSWNFGDGGSSTEANPTHIFAIPGTYQAILTVTDDQGGTGSAGVTITVDPGVCTVNCLRSVAIRMKGRNAGSGVRIAGAIYVRSETGVKVSNALVQVQWTLPNGSTTLRSAYTNSRGAANFVIFGPHGTYTLAVEDITLIGWLFDPEHSVLSKSITK